MSEAAAEKVFYDRDGVRVTSARFQVGAQTYAMSAVNSVAYQKQSATYVASGLLGCVGFPALIFGALALISEASRVMGAVGVVFGLVLCGGAIVVAKDAKPTYTVVLTTGSGQTTALSHNDPAKVEPVVRALNEALVSRG